MLAGSEYIFDLSYGNNNSSKDYLFERYAMFDYPLLSKSVFIIRGIGYRVILVENMLFDIFQDSRCYLLFRAGHSSLSFLSLNNFVGARVLKKERKLVIFSIVSSLVSIISKRIHLFREPSVYTGRGLRYKGVFFRRKLGKKDIRKGKFF